MMITSLRNIKVHLEEPQAVVFEDDFTLESLIGDTVLGQEFELPADDDGISLRAQLDTLTQLQAFKASVEKFGLTRSVIAFADYNKELSAAIPAIPSLEALTADLSVKKSQDAVAALEASIGDMVEVFVRTLKAKIKNRLARFSKKKEALGRVELRLKVLNDMMAKGRVFNEALAKKKRFKLLKHEDLVLTFAAAKQAHALVETVTKEELPQDEKSYKKWFADIRSKFNALSEATCLEIDEYDRFKTAANGKQPVDDTLAALGYNSVEQFHELYPEVAAITKTLPDYDKALNHLSDLANHTRRDATMAYLHKATVVYIDLIWVLGVWSIWVGDYATADTLKAIFACSEKAKKAD